jgi:Cu-processing system ATP-binding protein
MIEARGLTKRFGRLRVLDGLDLAVPHGQVTAIIGPNGSGKTTFNKSILGLVRPDGGELLFDGVRTNGDPAYRARVGYMPQAARFPENLCADEVIRLVDEIRGTPARRDEELLATFDLGPAMKTPVRLLSGGMRQRINAALAFLFEPELLILDEPTAGLDPVASSALKDKILRARDAGRTFIITSHVLSELEELADRIAFLLDGKVRFSGSQHELRAMTGEPTLERAIARLMTRRTS